MKDTDVIQTLQSKLALPVGRHLYGVLRIYPALNRFAEKLQQARGPEGKVFPAPLNVNRGILQAALSWQNGKRQETEIKRVLTGNSRLMMQESS
jgi:hypothetical protein